MLIKPKKKFWMSGIAPYYSAGVVGPPVLTFVSSVVLSPSGSTLTTASANLGTTSGFTTRRIIATVSAVDSFGGTTMNSATINGVSATIHDQVELGSGPFAAILSADVPTGTTGVTITMTFSGSVFGGGATAIYSVDDALLVSTTPSTGKNTASAVTTVSTTAITQSVGGFVVTTAGLNITPTGFAVTGQTTDAFGGANRNINTHLAPIASGGSLAVVSTWTNASNIAIVAAAWR